MTSPRLGPAPFQPEEIHAPSLPRSSGSPEASAATAASITDVSAPVAGR